MSRIFMLLFVVSLLSACGGSSSSSSTSTGGLVGSDTHTRPVANQNAPTIENLFTDVRHVSKYYGGTKHLGNTETIKFLVSVEVNDPQGLENISLIYFYKNDGVEWFWNLYDASESVATRNECRRQDTAVFECLFHDANHPHSIELWDWELAVEDKDGNITTQTFSFKLPGGEEASEGTFIYSKYYQEDTRLGVPALQSLTEESDEVFIFSQPGSQSYDVRFRVTDTRVVDYGLELWGFNGVWRYIGYVPPYSPSIVSSPIVSGLETRVQLPWTELQLFDGYTPSDIDGFHIILFDKYVEAPDPDDGGWFNYLGISDFIFPDIRIERNF